MYKSFTSGLESFRFCFAKTVTERACVRVRARVRACFFVFQSVLLILQAPHDDVFTVLKGYGVSIHLYIAMNMRTCQLPSVTTRMKFTHLQTFTSCSLELEPRQ